MIIVDIDNCVSDDSHRWGLPWDEYHGKFRLDEYVPLPGDSAAYAFKLFITARPEKYRDETVAWLLDTGAALQSRFDLIMRKDDDTRSSVCVKGDGLLDFMHRHPQAHFDGCYDDRKDVLERYKAIIGSAAEYHHTAINNRQLTPADILAGGQRTFIERGATYGNNYSQIGQLMRVLYPDGIPAETLASPAFNNMYQIANKLVRFTHSGLTHQDSIHDIMVYAAIAESTLNKGT